MTYNPVLEYPINTGQVDQWLELPGLFSKPNQIIQYDGNIPQSWETLGRIFQGFLIGEPINDFIINDDFRWFYPIKHNRVNWITADNEAFKLWIRLHPYTRAGVLRIWESDTAFYVNNQGQSVNSNGDVLSGFQYGTADINGGQY